MQPLPDADSLRNPRCVEDLLLYKVARAARAGGAMATRLIEGGFGITRREWAMIGTLAQLDEITSSRLAERLHLDRVRTSRAVRGLVDKKLITRRQNAQDKREVHLRLSQSGHRLYAELFPRIAALNHDLLEGIDAAKIGVFLQCLERLEQQGRELSARGAVTEKADRRAGGTRHRWPERGG